MACLTLSYRTTPAEGWRHSGEFYSFVGRGPGYSYSQEGLSAAVDAARSGCSGSVSACPVSATAMSGFGDRHPPVSAVAMGPKPADRVRRVAMMSARGVRSSYTEYEVRTQTADERFDGPRPVPGWFRCDVRLIGV